MRIEVITERLRANADVVAGQAAGVDDELARWKPAPDQWSILEVLGHLADEEVEDFRTRVDYTLHRPGEEWPPIDPQAWVLERSYNQRSLSKTLDRFLTRRAESIAYLEDLGAVDASAAYAHPSLGRITAGDLLCAWVAHDHIHIRQMNRLHRDRVVLDLEPHSPDYAGKW